MSTTYAIHRVDVGGLEEVANLFVDYLAFYGRAATRAQAHGFLAARVGTGQSIVLAAYADRGPTGFAQIYPTFSSLSMAPSWTLNDLYVATDARGSGVGRGLLQAVVDLAGAEGAAQVTLETARDNRTARGLYESEGFAAETTFLGYSRKVGAASPSGAP
jgi:ribosomal protein S18 acetylase RimI-like enzyme